MGKSLLCFTSFLLHLFRISISVSSTTKALDDWCSNKTSSSNNNGNGISEIKPVPVAGNFTLASRTTCILREQVIVETSLFITGEKASITKASNFAVITQNQTADVDKHRLFWIKSGQLVLSFVNLTGGRVEEKCSVPAVLPSYGECAGGLVYITDGGLLNTSFTILEHGKASLGGGIAVLSSSISSKVWIGKQSILSNNFATYDGGAVYMNSKGSVQAVESLFVNNTSLEFGGGVYAQRDTKITLIKSQFIGNNAGDTGGGLFVMAPISTTIDDTVFSNNMAKTGGGACIIAQGSTSVQITSSLFKSNRAIGAVTCSGGGLYLSGGSTTANILLNDVTFDSNTADAGTAVADDPSGMFQTSGGGASFSTMSSIMNASSLLFVNNFAGGHGGAAVLNDISAPSNTFLDLFNWTLRQNIAANNGGGLSLRSSTKVAVVGCTLFEQNKAVSMEANVGGWRSRWYLYTTSPNSASFPFNTLRADLDQVLEQVDFPDVSSFISHWGTGVRFGAYFSGVLRVEISGMYRFKLKSDDDSSLKINNIEIVNANWYDASGKTGTKNLTSGVDYDISVGYYQGEGGGSIQIQWEPVGACGFVNLPGSSTHGVFTKTQSSPLGGGIHVERNAAIHIHGPTLFDSNVAHGGDGGALYIDGSTGSAFRSGSGDIYFKNNVAMKFMHHPDSVSSVEVGQGLGGGIFSIRAQIGDNDNPVSARFLGNVPSGLHSSQSLMFLKSPMEQYADGIVVGVKDFPFPIPICPKGQRFPNNDKDPWDDLLKFKRNLSNISTMITGKDICYNCPAGWSNNEVGSSACVKCQRGEAQNVQGQSSCKNCATGMFASTTELKRCSSCPAGFASNINSSTSCTKCIPGRFQSNEQQAECLECLAGQYSDTLGAIRCNQPDAGYIAVGDSSVAKVADGWYRVCSANGACTSSEPCKVGTFRELTAKVIDHCQICPVGWSSFGGSIACFPCAKGKYRSENLQSLRCEECPLGQFQPQEQTGSISCQDCPIGWNNDQRGESGCLDKGFLKPEDCSDTQYLNDVSMLQSDWKCLPCPIGGSCRGPVIKSTIAPLFGWWPSPQRNLTFIECYFHPACPGAPNPKLQGKYSNAIDGADPANQVLTNMNLTNYSCAVQRGFQLNSRLCHICSERYRRGSAGSCILCPEDPAANWGLIVVGFFAILILFTIIIASTIAAAGKLQPSDGIQKIMLNYFQVANMARTFPLQWPSELEGLFDFQGAFSTVGGNLLNPDCVTTTTSAASLFYIKKMTFAVLPFATVFFSFLLWFLYGIFQGTPFFAKRTEPTATTPKDKFVATFASIMYLLFPTLITGAFELFDCRQIDFDETPNVQWLAIDFEEQCYVGQHLLMVWLLGVSQLILYVVGLPLLMLWFLARNRNNLDKHVTRFRYGMLYASYKPERFYWEIFLSLRKIIVVAVSVFGPAMGPARQALLVQFILLVCIVLEIIGEPFEEATARHKILGKLEAATLMVLWGTMWCGSLIFSSVQVQDNKTVNACSVIVGIINSAMIIMLIVRYVQELGFENRNSALVTRLRTLGSFRQAPANDEEQDENASGRHVNRVVLEMPNLRDDVNINWSHNPVESL